AWHDFMQNLLLDPKFMQPFIQASHLVRQMQATQDPPEQSASVAQCLAAPALLASPKQANAIPARPTPNFFSAARRVTDWARLLVSSSNWVFIFFLSFLSLLLDHGLHGLFSRLTGRLSDRRCW